MTGRGGACALTILLAALGCSSNPAPSQDGGATSNADAFVQASVCSVPWLLAGKATTELPVTVRDGDSSGNDVYSVACTVHAVGAGFDVTLSLSDQGPEGASVTITSPSGAGDVSASGGSEISATFTGAHGIIAHGRNCTITPTYQGMPVSNNPSVFAGKGAGGLGRAWGHVSCPIAALTTEGGAPDAAGSPCDAEADFLFENCSQ
ncbi:MAG TPA: hypothetical protein VF765_06925 [Polyangiaceae bacterium]